MVKHLIFRHLIMSSFHIYICFNNQNFFPFEQVTNDLYPICGKFTSFAYHPNWKSKLRAFQICPHC